MKRFYKEATVGNSDQGYLVLLDGRQVKTPGRESLLVPTMALADAIADEWQSQGDEVDPAGMHQTRLANTAIDRVMTQFDAVAGEVAGFGGSDLICYRADHPEKLASRQAEVWDTYVDWAARDLGAALVTTTGIMPVSQSDEALAALSKAVHACTAFELAGLHGVTTAFGSLTIGLAHMKGFAPFEAAWQASILDEIFQEEEWGEDAESTERRENLYADARAASEFLSHLAG